MNSFSNEMKNKQQLLLIKCNLMINFRRTVRNFKMSWEVRRDLPGFSSSKPQLNVVAETSKQHELKEALKHFQSEPDSNRQAQELSIEPLGRLLSLIFLLTDILKHTPKSNIDYQYLKKAIQDLKDLMAHVSEDGKKVVQQMEMFDVFYSIKYCPPHLLSSHRVLISKTDMQEVTDVLNKKGGVITMFLFDDKLEICKKSKGNHKNIFKSPGVVSMSSTSKHKSYKHLILIPLSSIKRIVDVVDNYEFKSIFALVTFTLMEQKEQLFAFKLVESTPKSEFISSLCDQIKLSLCRTECENLIIRLEPDELELHNNDETGNRLTKALKSTKRGLSRAVSTIISPLRGHSRQKKLQDVEDIWKSTLPPNVAFNRKNSS